MPKSLFLGSTEHEAGASVLSLGLMDIFKRSRPSVGFFKPVGLCSQDADVALQRSAFQLEETRETLCPIHIDHARELIGGQRQGEMLERVSGAFAKLREKKDFVVIEGINHHDGFDAFDHSIDEAIAAHLGVPVLLIAHGGHEEETNVEQLINVVSNVQQGYEQRGCEVIGAIVNRVQEKPFEPIRDRLFDAFHKSGLKLYGVMPNLQFLSYPKLDEIAAALHAEVLSGEDFLRLTASRVIVGAMEPHNFLRYLNTDGTLVIIPGDRTDNLLTVAASQKAPARRRVSGVVLTGGLRPPEEVLELLADMQAVDFPILSVEMDTFTAATAIKSMTVRIRPQDRDKIHTASTAVAQYVDGERLLEALAMPRVRRRAGAEAFLSQLVEQARLHRKRIVLPESREPRTLRAVARALELEICTPVLIGDPEPILAAAKEAGAKIDGAEIVEPARHKEIERATAEIVELRKHKRGGMTPEVARAWLLEDPIHYGTALVRLGAADGLVSGAIHSTADTIRPALQVIGCRPEVGIASSVFFMPLKDRVLLYGDCAIIPNPNAKELAAIAISSAHSARAFGIEPFVAMLSYSTGRSGSGESVDKVSEATKLIKERNPDFAIDGPLQYDAAIDPDVGRLKLPDSPVAGRANVFIFPDLDAGNIAYKAVQRSAGVLAVGPMLQGLNKPVNDLSRGCSVNDIVYTIAVTAIQATAI